MSWSLDTPKHAGGVTCVPIIDTVICVTGGLPRIAGYGRKRPVLILVFGPKDVVGIDLSGETYDVDAIEGRYPEAIAKATALIAKATP